jgi:mannose/cellobiose epimerase-like protein (N-acyl-D-glucosamine 2-epimerase family)
MAKGGEFENAARGAARGTHAELASWLREAAYPTWATRGVDFTLGGFHERLSLAGAPLPDPRRARVQPRQAYAFAQAPALGWRGDAPRIVAHGLEFFLARFRRPDGFFRTLIAPDGTPLDDRVLLYDQAFALLGFAASQKVLGPRPNLVEEAVGLRTLLYTHLKRTGLGFDSGLPARQPLLSNPHMHLLEASLAWMAVSEDPAWRTLANEIGTLALLHFVDPSTGAVREAFDAAWSPVPGMDGRVIEPGHQFEWAWLLLRWGGAGSPQDSLQARRAALRLIDLGEQHGVAGGVAINSLLDDFSIHEATARLWPQTERIKAAALAARLTGETRYWSIAVAAARGLLRFLKTDVPGLWHDRLTLQDTFVNEPAPASSFYHIVAAISELGAALADTDHRVS